MTNIILIAAISENNVIGNSGKLPWSLKDDLRLFSALTKCHTVVMGRKNYESIGKPLPNRLNVILSRDPNYEAEGCIVMASLEDAINLSHGDGSSTFIIGGADIYKLALPISTHFFLSRVHADVPGDVRFPIFDENEWDTYFKTEYMKDISGGNEHAFTFSMMKKYNV